MNDDFDKSLGEALKQNGHLDPSRLSELKKQTSEVFDSRMKRVERWLMGCLIFLAGFAILALTQSLNTQNVRTQIAQSVIALILMQGTVLIKLWYWQMNTKLSLLKEAKQTRLVICEFGGIADLPAEMAEYRPKRGMEQDAGGLSRAERIAWKIGLVLAVVLAFVLGRLG